MLRLRAWESNGKNARYSKRELCMRAAKPCRFAAPMHDSSSEYCAHSVFSVLSCGFSSKRDTARSLTFALTNKPNHRMSKAPNRRLVPRATLQFKFSCQLVSLLYAELACRAWQVHAWIFRKCLCKGKTSLRSAMLCRLRLAETNPLVSCPFYCCFQAVFVFAGRLGGWLKILGREKKHGIPKGLGWYLLQLCISSAFLGMFQETRVF